MPLKPLTDDARHAGARLAIAVFIATAIGFGMALPLLPSRGFSVATADSIAAACKWAAMTCIVVQTPHVAKVGQTGAERVLGTIVGGAAGFAAYSVAHTLDRTPGAEVEDGMLLAVLAAIVAYITSVGGYVLGLTYSSRLCAQSFFLVAFGASAREVAPSAAGALALSRVGGISAGVLLIEAASVVLWPRAATTEALKELKKGLIAQIAMAEAAWRAALTWVPPCPRDGGATAAAAAGDMMTPLLSRDGTDPEAARLPPEQTDTLTADAVSAAAAAVTAALDTAVSHASTTRSEVYLEVPCTRPRRACFLPGTPWGPAGPHGPPLNGVLLADCVAAARSVSRALAALHASRPRTGVYAALLAVTYPPALLQGAADDAISVVRAVADASPGPPPPSARDAVMRVRARAAALLAISDYAKRALHRTALRGMRSGSVDSGAAAARADSLEPEGGVSPRAALEELPSDLAAALAGMVGEALPPDDASDPATQSTKRTRARLGEALARASSVQIVASAFPATSAGFLAHVRWLGLQVALDELGTSLSELVAAATALADSLPAALKVK